MAIAGSIELQVISKILTTESPEELNTLCSYDSSYYAVFKPQIEYILDHRSKHEKVPDVFTFQTRFPDTTLIQVNEPLTYLLRELNDNKQQIIMVETVNKLVDLGSGDVKDAWSYVGRQYDRVSELDSNKPLDIVKDAHKRSQQIIEFSKQARIPTGFDEIDKLMYGGFSTVEELVILIARTNTGKSWVCTKMMESAQKNQFPVLYYSPEMQASYLGTRFDTWRGHHANNQLFQGNYSEQYVEYLDTLSKEGTSAYVMEDKDVADGGVNVEALKNFVKRYKIKLLIVDGLSYMEDSMKSSHSSEKYKNICSKLFTLSKQCSCAVVVAMQANRESQNNKDDKGEVFPNIYNAEGSDHPARIATQVFSMRQVFETHVLDIRLEKTRMANNQKPELSYAWDINTGNMQHIPGDQGDAITNAITPVQTALPGNASAPVYNTDKSISDIDLSSEEELEF